MEPKFKTSFIPKQSLPNETTGAVSQRNPNRGSSGGIIFLLGVIIFVGVATAAVGVFLWRNYVENEIANKSTMLKRSREAFQPELIRELERLDNRIIVAESLLDKHKSPTALFDLLAERTLTSVQFSTFSLQIDGGGALLEMGGRATDFESVALQSDVFGSNQFIEDPIISDLDVEGEAAEFVSFNLTARIGDRFLSYENQISDSSGQQIQPMDSTAEINGGVSSTPENNEPTEANTNSNTETDAEDSETGAPGPGGQ